MRALTPAYAGPRSRQTRPLGLGGLGTRRQRFWFGVTGLVALALPYLATFVAGIRADLSPTATPVSLPALTVPVATFPQVSVPGARATAPSRAGATGARTAAPLSAGQRAPSGPR